MFIELKRLPSENSLPIVINTDNILSFEADYSNPNYTSISFKEKVAYMKDNWRSFDITYDELKSIIMNENLIDIKDMMESFKDNIILQITALDERLIELEKGELRND